MLRSMLTKHCARSGRSLARSTSNKFSIQSSDSSAWAALGFGFIEIGTVTAKPQPGNLKPRIFRLPEQRALINSLGFNNVGADAIAKRLRRLHESGRWPAIPVGVNIGKSKATPLE